MRLIQVASRGFDSEFLMWVSTVRLAVLPSLSKVCGHNGALSGLVHTSSTFKTYLFDICILHIPDYFRR